MDIDGACHCGNIRFVLRLPDTVTELPARRCGCSFCRKHGGVWTSHGDGALAAVLGDEAKVSRYRFGTGTAEFYVCARCGGVPFTVSEIDGRRYCVVNVNTFDGSKLPRLAQSDSDFDGEGVDSRLARRKRNWIPSVQISVMT